MTLAKALGETRGRSKFVSTALETFLAKTKSTAAERHFLGPHICLGMLLSGGRDDSNRRTAPFGRL
jgi:hypothetical protein